LSKITDVNAREILDSRGEPTLEVEISTDDGLMATDSVPSGISTGSFESIPVKPEIAVNTINQTIKPKIIGLDPLDQFGIDQLMLDMDGTGDKSSLGANTILGVSLALSRVAALTEKMPLYWYINKLYSRICGEEIEPSLPTPMMVMIEGGKHAKNKLCLQEILVIGKLEHGKKIWHTLRELITSQGLEPDLGLEGGFSPKLNYDEDAIDLLQSAIEISKLSVSKDIMIGLDIAANYCNISNEDILHMLDNFPIYSIEDPAPEDKIDHWAELKLELDRKGKDYLLVGDDLFVTSKERLEAGIENFAANAMIVKVNQTGTLTETLKVISLAKKADFVHILSHRSGETMDSYISDLAVGTAAKYLKAGAPFASEREIKYKRLEEIASELT